MSITSTQLPISTLVREATSEAHSRAESTGFVTHLMAGHLSLTAFTALVRQHRAIYASLERLGKRVEDQPGAAALVRPELARSSALHRDLADLTDLTGAVPEIEPATRRYTERMDAINNLPGYAAHAYTRYLGDLSGGQVIRTMMQRHYGLTTGLSFYTFDQIEKIPPFKASYREALDALPLDDAGRERLVTEAREAFAFNEAVFTDLGKRFPPAA
ncbi:heme oxygenase (biliverdin-producing) [Ruania rhizosphaerae]|uniref:biliverdin-producing heme oxygenase n=1 Tax=Ruania rhizosphaerae TaxID=1840413 RepID=UPI0013573B45|nr:biliverdin-producing heme oxygenase [Ruania rhizosphaerae]